MSGINKKHADFWVRALKTFAQGSFGSFATLNLAGMSVDGLGFDKTVWLTVLSGGISAVASMLSNIDYSKQV
jgi:hypothetical protein